MGWGSAGRKAYSSAAQKKPCVYCVTDLTSYSPYLRCSNTTRCIPGTFAFHSPHTTLTDPRNRTASELKIKKVQDNTADPTRVARDVSRFGAIGLDLQSGSADEAADRALAGVARKLDKALSVEYTVNELIAEATDIVNLATIYHGEFWSCSHFWSG